MGSSAGRAVLSAALAQNSIVRTRGPSKLGRIKRDREVPCPWPLAYSANSIARAALRAVLQRSNQPGGAPPAAVPDAVTQYGTAINGCLSGTQIRTAESGPWKIAGTKVTATSTPHLETLALHAELNWIFDGLR